ncbi:hypothetical protein IQ03_01260 [Gemmobacter caeni]|uniref:Uncharacterized protein n=1 Tax=Gemmobacter caeni TaxID=589035 RepID=A0A2T6B8T9_9RHOB|nr:hypothetical protein [Gemmobacter caeni]PTX52487.1 hypothetical protein C8N34_102267 [Gemmobacter caeni]TWJ02842.1 hypothetical protein IQ03_01260 [Gemmobacter caeni]
MSGEKPSRASRITSYFGRRVGNPFINRVGRDALTGGISDAKSVLQVDRVSRDEVRGAIRGRYQDGGRARFATMAAERGLSEADLLAMERMRIAQFRMMTLVSLIALFAGSAIPFLTEDWLISVSGLIFGLFSLLFLTIGLRHDFAAWQIRNRRFGGIREYFDDRWV